MRDESTVSSHRTVTAARPTFADVEGLLLDLRRILMSGRLMLGPYLEEFEHAFAQSVHCRYAIGVSSCTAALEIMLRYIGVDQAEVVVPTNTFVATANAVLYAGGRPVFADINPKTLGLDRDTLLKAVTARTRVVILVHLGGLIAPDVVEMVAQCRTRRITLIEDCAHAQGASFQGISAGAFGMAGGFSFYPTKILTTGAGGMIVTNDEGLNEYARSVRLHGRGSGPRQGLDEIVHLGNDWFLDELRSAIGLQQLRQFEQVRSIRRTLFGRYLAALRDIPSVRPIEPDPQCEPSYYKCMVLLDPAFPVAQVTQRLAQDYGIEAESLYYPPCHLQPLYRRLMGSHPGMCPVAEDLLPRQLCLPLHAAMSVDDVDYVVSSLIEILRSEKRVS